MADDTPDRGRIRTGETVLSVVEALATEGGAGVTTVADRLGIAKSTAHAHLQTLLDQRFVVKRDGQYHVGLRFLELGQSARAPWDAYGFIEEKVEELAEEPDAGPVPRRGTRRGGLRLPVDGQTQRPDRLARGRAHPVALGRRREGHAGPPARGTGRGNRRQPGTRTADGKHGDRPVDEQEASDSQVLVGVALVSQLLNPRQERRGSRRGIVDPCFE